MRTRIFGASALAMVVAHAADLRAQTAATAHAAPQNSVVIQDIVVTASKRAEKLQKIPQSIQVLDSRKLDQLHITEFTDYLKYIPSLTTQTAAPDQTTIYLRGVVDGGNANHSGPLPTVGSYLDDMPITTIGGTLDVHMYDVARIEVLPGPQGTLYGASSESGTVRFITNQPDPGKFAAGYQVEGDTVYQGGLGGTAEGFVNIPITDDIAVRLVAYDEHDAGYINNVYGTRAYYLKYGGPVTGVANNAAFVKNDFNPNDVFGGRAALRVNLNEDWTITPEVIFQDTRNRGVFGYEPSVGTLDVQRFQPDTYHDRWLQAAMNVTGHIGDYTLTYAGGYFTRAENAATDYTDYSVFYDAKYGSGAYWQDKHGNPLATPAQEIIEDDHFYKFSNEIRLTSPAQDRLRFIVGFYQEEQGHHIIQDYEIQGFGPQISVPGWPNTIWLTNQNRVDRDLAGFGEVAFDFTPQFTATGGVRYYYYDNSLFGFFGFGQGYNALTGYSSGEGAGATPGLNATGGNCLPGQSFPNTPCVNLDKDVVGRGETHKINLQYKIDPDRMVYFTYSTGYRPGGVNRRADQGTYQADTLTNFELGFKSAWLQHRLIWNTALYDEDWNNFQFSYLGANSFTIIKNAPTANIKGLETELQFRATDALTLSGGMTLTHAELTKTFCTDNNGNVLNNCTGSNVAPISIAAAGAALPYTPDVKGYGTARYTFPLNAWQGYVQGDVSFQTRSEVGLRTSDKIALGSLPAYALFGVSAGVSKNLLSVDMFIKNLFNELGELNRYTPCTVAICTLSYPGLPQAVYVVPVQPFTFGIRLSQKF